ncbi:MAG: molybdopterin-dependent oxidoreductase [Flavobacteriaceae bacterium]
MTTTRTVPSICRNCLAYCPIMVTVENGRPVKVTGDPEAPAFGGYTCPKGRALPEQHNFPGRILKPLKQVSGGGFEEIGSAEAAAEAADRVRAIIEKYGPRSVAFYTGTGPVSHPTSGMLATAWMSAVGSKMIFSAATIDKPAERTAVALHGNWIAGMQGFDDADTWMIIGANPVIAKSNGAPLHNPGMRLKEAQDRGMKLVVIDPRRTETAKRAHVHLQIIPGEDPAVLAGIIHVIIKEKLYDAAFVAENAQGFAALADAVRPWTPSHVAKRAGIAEEDLIEAARCFAKGKRGGAVCSTGPSFATSSNLSYYLTLCLITLCGRWARAGEKAPFPNVLLPAFTPKAQPYPTYPAVSERPMRVRGLKENASGLPTAALADEILTEGEGQIRALFCSGGNPVLAWPDRKRAEAAMRKLDLLVVFDYHMTATAELADYVIPPPLSLELPATSQKVEGLKFSGVSRGYPMPWGQYTPAVADYPAGSDLVDESQFFFLMAQRMGLELKATLARGSGPYPETPPDVIPIDMSRMPTIEELVELSCRGSRVPLDEVKAYPHGHIFDLDVKVAPRDADCETKLELAAGPMMDELAHLRNKPGRRVEGGAYPLLMICRRANNFMNSVGQDIEILKPPRHTPAAMHPDDLERFGLAAGALAHIRSAHGEMRAEIAADASLRPGTISVVHGFGSLDEDTEGPQSVNRLIGLDECDPMTGIPRMTGVPVTVVAVDMTRH